MSAAIRAAASSTPTRCVSPLGPIGEFHRAFGQRPAHCDPPRDAHQFGVGELHPGPGVAIVQQHLHAQALQLAVEALGRGHRGVVAHAGHGDHCLIRRYRHRPDQTPVVVVGLGHRGHGPADAYAVGTHGDGALHPVGVEHGGPHGFGVAAAQLEDVARLDAANHFQGASAVHARLSGRHLPQVEPLVHRDVALDVHARVVPAVGVGAGCEVAPAPQGVVGHDRQVLHAHRPERAWMGTQTLQRLGRFGGADVDGAGAVGQLLEVELVVAPHQGQRHRAVQHHHHRLDLPLGGRSALDGLQGGDGAHSRRGEPHELVAGLAVIDGRQRSGGPLHVGRVAASRTAGDVVLRRRGRPP